MIDTSIVSPARGTEAGVCAVARSARDNRSRQADTRMTVQDTQRRTHARRRLPSPEATRRVAGGPSAASDRRINDTIFFRPRSGVAEESRRLVCGPRLLPESDAIPPDFRRSLASLGPPATVRDASGVYRTGRLRSFASATPAGTPLGAQYASRGNDGRSEREE